MNYPYKTALVTGASSGIGRELARRLAVGGTALVLVARRTDRLAELGRELYGQHGVDVEVLTADLAEEKDLVRVEERLTDPARPIELLVNNAGFDVSGEFAAVDVDAAVAEIQVDVVAPVRLTRAVLPRMIARGRGGVLMVSSTVAGLPLPNSAVYGGAKAFLSSFSESIHMEVADHGVHVTCLAAGLTRTEFHGVAGIDTSGMPKSAQWMQPGEVAAAGLAAVAAGRVSVVPGSTNRRQAMLMRHLPRPVLRAMVKRFYRKP